MAEGTPLGTLIAPAETLKFCILEHMIRRGMQDGATPFCHTLTG